MKNYVPAPINTSNIKLTPELEAIAEELAANTHEVWAKGRVEDGWTYGPVRSDKDKETPCLVPYGELSEGEKDFDRNTAIETIKVLLAKGYKIVREDEVPRFDKFLKKYLKDEKGYTDAAADQVVDSIPGVRSRLVLEENEMTRFIKRHLVHSYNFVLGEDGHAVIDEESDRLRRYMLSEEAKLLRKSHGKTTVLARGLDIDRTKSLVYSRRIDNTTKVVITIFSNEEEGYATVEIGSSGKLIFKNSDRECFTAVKGAVTEALNAFVAVNNDKESSAVKDVIKSLTDIQEAIMQEGIINEWILNTNNYRAGMTL